MFLSDIRPELVATGSCGFVIGSAIWELGKYLARKLFETARRRTLREDGEWNARERGSHAHNRSRHNTRSCTLCSPLSHREDDCQVGPS